MNERKTMTTPSGREHRGNDDFSQAGDLFRLLAPDAQQRLIHNIVMSMKGISREIQARQIRHFLKADVRYGRGVMDGLCCDPKKQSGRLRSRRAF